MNKSSTDTMTLYLPVQKSSREFWLRLKTWHSIIQQNNKHCKSHTIAAVERNPPFQRGQLDPGLAHGTDGRTDARYAEEEGQSTPSGAVESSCRPGRPL